jgi:selT/selW/selH-like putative selenoprotein
VRDALHARGIADIELQPGRSGQFDVTIDGDLKYSRHRSGRFPSPEDIAKLVG